MFDEHMFLFAPQKVGISYKVKKQKQGLTFSQKDVRVKNY